MSDNAPIGIYPLHNYANTRQILTNGDLLAIRHSPHPLMPIELSHPDDPDLNVRPGTNEATLLKFLYRHRRYGFTPKELSDETAVAYSSIQKTLDRLREKSLIDKTTDGYYHALDNDTIARRVASLHSLDAISRDLREDDSLSDEAVAELPDLDPPEQLTPTGTRPLNEDASLTDEEIDALPDLDPDEDR